MPDYDYLLLHFFNSKFYSPGFFKYFTEIGNGFIAAAFVIPLLSLISDKFKAFNFVPLSADRGTKLNALNLSEISESNGITKAAAINPLPISVKYLKKPGL